MKILNWYKGSDFGIYYHNIDSKTRIRYTVIGDWYCFQLQKKVLLWWSNQKRLVINLSHTNLSFDDIIKQLNDGNT
jgi:hypothetical protein